MRENEGIKKNLYVLLAVLVVFAAGLTAALAIDAKRPAPESEQAQNQTMDIDSDAAPANIETGAVKQPQKTQQEMDVATRKVDADLQPDTADTTTYALRTRDGYLQVYVLETGDFYMETSIVYKLLPESVQTQIDHGKYFESEEELFEFLENYSS